MSSKEKGLFLLLIVVQALHSIEEYYFSLWEVFSPARIVSGLLSPNLSIGFLIVNSTIVAFGVWSYWVPVRRSSNVVPRIVWLWLLLEFGNGVGHVWLAASARSYFPGIYTAPFLLTMSLLLAASIMKRG